MRDLRGNFGEEMSCSFGVSKAGTMGSLKSAVEIKVQLALVQRMSKREPWTFWRFEAE